MAATQDALIPAPQGDPEWVTLKEAAEVAEVSVSSLRKAYRTGRIESQTAAGPYGEQRLVRLDQVRTVMGTRAPSAAAPALLPQLLEEVTRGWSAFEALHQAGQELGVVRERAGRAEAEADVLRGVVNDLRARLDRAEVHLSQARESAPPLSTPEADGAAADLAPARRGVFGFRRHRV